MTIHLDFDTIFKWIGIVFRRSNMISYRKSGYRPGSYPEYVSSNLTEITSCRHSL